MSPSFPAAAPASQDAVGVRALAPSRLRFFWAACAAIAAGAGLLIAGNGTPPLLHLGTAAFLSLVVFEDVRRLRIPNALCFPALLVALVGAGITGGVNGMLTAALGALAALLLLLVPYAIGWLGAGDAKAMLVVGALFGMRPVGALFLHMVVAGGILALLYLIARGELLPALARWYQSLAVTLVTRKPTWFPAPRGSAAAGALPFGVAMACGAMAFFIRGNLQ